MHDDRPDDRLLALRDELRAFCAVRNWQGYHTPKNLAMAMIVEAAELVEHFQWATPEESLALTPEKKAEVQDEVADTFIYLLELADVLDIDLIDAARLKMTKNARKYPAPTKEGGRV
ncbi:nucleotide pyrophosphohydrolase [Denitratisoma sp. agr-D3]